MNQEQQIMFNLKFRRIALIYEANVIFQKISNKTITLCLLVLSFLTVIESSKDE